MKALLFSVGVAMAGAGAAQAACLPIAEPAPVPAIETMKEALSQGDAAAAFEGFGISPQAMDELVADISKAIPGPVEGCAAIKRSRPSQNFASELFVMQSQGTFYFFSVSGLDLDTGFVMLNVRYSTDFDIFRALVY